MTFSFGAYLRQDSRSMGSRGKSPRPRISGSLSDHDEVEVVEPTAQSFAGSRNRRSTASRTEINATLPTKRAHPPTRITEQRSRRPRSSSSDDLFIPGGGGVPRVPRSNCNPPASHVNHSRGKPRRKDDSHVVNVDDDDNNDDNDDDHAQEHERVRRPRPNTARASRPADGIAPRRAPKPRRLQNEQDYNVKQLQKDRGRREGNRSQSPERRRTPNRARKHAQSETINIDVDDDDDDGDAKSDDAITITRPDPDMADVVERRPSPPPVPKRILPNRNAKRRSLDRKQEEAAEELKELTSVDAPYAGPTHLIFKYPPGGRGMIRVTAEERGRLSQRKYLNDSLIDFYLKYLETTLNRRAVAGRFTTKFFSSFFFGVLRRTTPIDYDGVKNWTKGIDLFSLEFVFVPICDSYHWSLIIVANLSELESFLDTDEDHGPGSPKIIYLDSLDPKRGQEFGNTMLHYLVEEYLTRKLKVKVTDVLRKETFSRFKKAIPILKPNVPIQSNEYDCGLYVLNSLSIFLGNIDDFQEKLLNGECNVRDVYSHIDIQKLRISIMALMDRFEADWKLYHAGDSEVPEGKMDTTPSNDNNAGEDLGGEQDTSRERNNRSSISPPGPGAVGTSPSSGEVGGDPMQPDEREEVLDGGSSIDHAVSWQEEAAELGNGTSDDHGRSCDYTSGREEEDRMDLDGANGREGSESDQDLPGRDLMQGVDQNPTMAIDLEEEGGIRGTCDDTGEESTKDGDKSGLSPFFNTSKNQTGEMEMAVEEWQQNGEAEDIVVGDRAGLGSRLEAVAAKRTPKTHAVPRRKRRNHPPRSHSREGNSRHAPAAGYGGAGYVGSRSGTPLLSGGQREMTRGGENRSPGERMVSDPTELTLTHYPESHDPKVEDLHDHEEVLDGSEFQ